MEAIALLLLSFPSQPAFCQTTAPDKSVGALQTEANKAFESGDYTKVRELCKKSHQVSQQYPDSYRLEAMTYTRQHDHKAAARVLSQGQLRAPENIHIAVELASAYHVLKDTERLKQQLVRSADLINRNLISANWGERLCLLNLCHEAGLHELEPRALLHYRRPEILDIALIGCRPSSADNRRAFEYALASLATARAGSDDAANLRDCCVTAASRLWDVGDYEKVEKLSKAALAVDPNNPHLHLLLGGSLCMKDGVDCKSWQQEFETAFNLNPAYAERISAVIISSAHRKALNGKNAAQLIHDADKWLVKCSYSQAASTFGLLVGLKAFDQAYRYYLRHGTLQGPQKKEPEFSALVFGFFGTGELEKAENLLDLRRANLNALQDICSHGKRRNIMTVKDHGVPFLLSVASRLQELDFSGASGPARDRLYQNVHGSFSALVLDSKRGNRATSQGLYEDYIEPIERARKRGPLPPYCLHALAQFYARCDEADVAETVLDDCIKKFPRDAMSYKLRAAIRFRRGFDEAAKSDIRVLESMNQRVSADEIRQLRCGFESTLAGDVIANRLQNFECTDSPQYLSREQRLLLAECNRTGKIEPLLMAAETAVVRTDYNLALELLARAEKLDKRNSRVYEVRSWVMDAIGKPEAAMKAREQARQRASVR